MGHHYLSGAAESNNGFDMAMIYNGMSDVTSSGLPNCATNVSNPKFQACYYTGTATKQNGNPVKPSLSSLTFASQPDSSTGYANLTQVHFRPENPFFFFFTTLFTTLLLTILTSLMDHLE